MYTNNSINNSNKPAVIRTLAEEYGQDGEEVLCNIDTDPPEIYKTRQIRWNGRFVVYDTYTQEVESEGQLTQSELRDLIKGFSE